MDKATVINYLKSARASIKNVPENARLAVGLLARNIGLDGGSGQLPLGTAVRFQPRAYRPESGREPVTIWTPPDGHYMTTFFDVDPWSPSGRYLAVTRVPFIWRIPYPGDRAQVCVIDLVEQTCTAVYETRGWGAQLGANVQWGANDDTIYCNDVIDGKATGVRIDRVTLQATPLCGPVYGSTRDRRYSFSGNLYHINAGIPGYGVPDRMFRRIRPTDPRSEKEGIWQTDLNTGETRLFLSLAEIAQVLEKYEPFEGGTYHVFNVKVNPRDDRLLAVIFLRGVPGYPGWPVQLMTCKLDGSDIRLALPYRLWRIGGHHPNWAPDGDHIVMNLRSPGEEMRFVRFRYDGSAMVTLAPGHKGSGHPSLDPSGRYLLTDAYTAEGFMDANGEVPIRLIDLQENIEHTVTRVYTNRIIGPRRIDPHPVWSRDGTRICFNAIVDGMRQVLIAEVF